MKALMLFATVALAGVLAQAETKVYEVKGMHCDECAKTISEKICKMPGIEKCEVEVGKMTLTAKHLDDAAVQKSLGEIGRYKFVKVTKIAD